MKSSDRLQLTPGMVVRMVADAAMIQIALIIAMLLRLIYKVAIVDDLGPGELGSLFRTYVSIYCDNAWPLTLICLVVFYFSGFYTYGRFYQGRYKALIVTQAVCYSYLFFAFLAYFFDPNLDRAVLHRSVLVVAWVLSIGLLVGSRLWVHMWDRVVRPEHEALSRKSKGERERVLVIGGAGYIGSALLPKLLAARYRVRLLDMMVFGEEPIKGVVDHPNLEIVQGDFRHVEVVVEAMQGVDAVIHLGAIVGDPACNLDKELTIDVNLSATRMIGELARAAGVQRFVFASTCSVYGACNEVLDERSIVRPVSLYGHTKLASERVLYKMANDRFQPTIVRFATIYGLSGRTRFDLVVNLLAAKAKTEGTITVFGGDQWRPFVHVDDAASAVSRILEAPVEVVGKQVFNVGSNDQNYTIRQIGEMIHELAVSAELVIDGEDSDARNYRVGFDKIHNLLNFTPQWTVEQGIQQVFEAIAAGEVSDYQDPKYSNVKFLSETGGSLLDRNDWARKMIDEITAEQP